MGIVMNHLIEKTIELLPSSYQQRLERTVNVDMREFLKDLFILEFLDSKTGNPKNIKPIYSHYKKDKYEKIKKQWMSSFKNSVEGKVKKRSDVDAEIEFIKNGIEKHVFNLKRDFKADSFDDIIERRIKEVEEWGNNPSSFFCDYRYVLQRTKEQVEEVLKVDAIIAISEWLIDEFNGDIHEFVKVTYKSQDPRKDIQVALKELLADASPSRVQSDEINGVSVTTVIGNDYESEIRTPKLTDLDFEVLDYVLRKLDVDFIEKQLIRFNVMDIVISQGKEEYDFIYESLAKVKDVSFSITSSHNTIDRFDLFDRVSIDKNTNEVIIKVSDNLHQHYIKSNVTRVYRNTIKNFEHPLSKNMFFLLQKERLTRGKEATRTIQKDISHYLYHYTFFSDNLGFQTRQKQENMNSIESSLLEIEKKGDIIMHFERVNNSFEIIFSPIFRAEVEGLLDTTSQQLEEL